MGSNAAEVVYDPTAADDVGIKAGGCSGSNFFFPVTCLLLLPALVLLVSLENNVAWGKKNASPFVIRSFSNRAPVSRCLMYSTFTPACKENVFISLSGSHTHFFFFVCNIPLEIG